MMRSFKLINYLNIILCSGSSAGDMGDVTPCNASPNLSTLMAFRPIIRDDTEEVWRLQIQSLLNQIPASPMELFQLLHRLIKVLDIFSFYCVLNLIDMNVVSCRHQII